MSKTARTHDISLIDYHVTDVETLSKVLNDAIAAACPMSCGTRYQEVYVLLLSWEDDDIGVDSEVAALEQVFRDLYGFDTGRWKIPSRMSHNALVSRLLSSLIQFESDDKLFITYYGGHGYMNEDRQCVWLWSVLRVIGYRSLELFSLAAPSSNLESATSSPGRRLSNGLVSKQCSKKQHAMSSSFSTAVRRQAPAATQVTALPKSSLLAGSRHLLLVSVSIPSPAI